MSNLAPRSFPFLYAFGGPFVRECRERDLPRANPLPRCTLFDTRLRYVRNTTSSVHRTCQLVVVSCNTPTLFHSASIAVEGLRCSRYTQKPELPLSRFLRGIVRSPTFLITFCKLRGPFITEKLISIPPMNLAIRGPWVSIFF